MPPLSLPPGSILVRSGTNSQTLVSHWCEFSPFLGVLISQLSPISPLSSLKICLHVLSKTLTNLGRLTHQREMTVPYAFSNVYYRQPLVSEIPLRVFLQDWGSDCNPRFIKSRNHSFDFLLPKRKKRPLKRSSVKMQPKEQKPSVLRLHPL